MNKLSIFVILFLTYSSSFSQNGISVGISYDFDQISESDQNLIISASESCITSLVNKDLKGFWDACHSKFKEATPYVMFSQMGEILIDMIPSKDSVVFYDAKKVSYTEEPKMGQFAVGGSLDKSHPKYMQFYTIAGIKEQSISLYRVNNSGYSKMITMKFGLEETKFRLTNFEINTSKIDDKNVDYYLKLATEWEKKDTKIPSFLALNMAYRFTYLGKGTQTLKSMEITEKLQKLQNSAEFKKEVSIWLIDSTEFAIINLDFLETKSDISPNLIYVSKEVLGRIQQKRKPKSCMII